jgi:hypothetical protein
MRLLMGLPMNLAVTSRLLEDNSKTIGVQGADILVSTTLLIVELMLTII